jgi:hypothetical protein
LTVTIKNILTEYEKLPAGEFNDKWLDNWCRRVFNIGWDDPLYTEEELNNELAGEDL